MVRVSRLFNCTVRIFTASTVGFSSFCFRTRVPVRPFRGSVPINPPNPDSFRSHVGRTLARPSHSSSPSSKPPSDIRRSTGIRIQVTFGFTLGVTMASAKSSATEHCHSARTPTSREARGPRHMTQLLSRRLIDRRTDKLQDNTVRGHRLSHASRMPSPEVRLV